MLLSSLRSLLGRLVPLGRGARTRSSPPPQPAPTTTSARGLRLALVVNDGSGGSPEAEALARQLEHHGAQVVTYPFEELDVIDLDAADRLVVAAGDGGVGPCAARAAAAGLPLAVVPSGTANDFAGFLGLPDDPEQVARLAADPRARIDEVDLCRSGQTPFVNAAACGMSVAAAEKATPLKETLGATAYAVGAVQASVSEEACTYEVLVDGRTVFEGAAWQVIVSGTGAFGAGSRVEEAEADDGRLDVTVLEEGSRLALPLRAWGLKRGGLADQEGVQNFRGRTVEVKGAEEWNVDGEHLQGAEHGHFRVDGRVEVVVP